MSIHSIVLLMWFRFRGNLRLRIKELSTVRGFVSAVSIVIFLAGLVLVTEYESAFAFVESLKPQPENLPALLSIGVILAIVSTVLLSSGPALHFDEAEVNWLWSAPLSRQILVAYKLISYSIGAIFTALLLTFILSGSLQESLVRFLGIFLTLMFIQTASTALRMGLDFFKVSRIESCNTRKKYRYTAYALVTAILSIALLVWRKHSTPSITPIMHQPWVEILLMPFSSIAYLGLHTELTLHMALDCLITIGMIILLTITILIFDRRLNQLMLEQSASASQRWSRAMRSGILFSNRSNSIRSSRPLARWGGFGSIAWNRWLYAWRTSSNTLIIMMLLAGVAGLFFGSRLSSSNTTYLAAAVYFTSLYFLPRILVFDFRGTPQLMETLHTLPLSASTICLGQLAIPVFWKSLTELTFLTGILITADISFATNWIVALALLPMVNFIVLSVDNLLFLLRPNRLLPMGRMDFDFLGRTLLDFLVKSLVVTLAATLAVGVAFWFVKNTHGGLTLFVISVIAVLFLICGSLLYILSKAFTGANVIEFNRL